MGIITFALRRPITIMVGVVALAIAALTALRSMPVDIFPKLNLPVIYVCQPYGGMDPAQMEGLLTNYYEFHFLYINGIQRVESKSVHGVALMKLVFHPGTNMAQAMAETITQVNRSRSYMPPGTVPPFVMRFDTGSVPVGYLVLSSENRPLGEIQDQALFKVRPIFASLPGVSAPPPFGGNQRTIVVRVDPDRLKAYQISPEDVITALSAGNTISPSGNIRIGDDFPIVPTNALARDLADMASIPIRNEQGGRAVYLRDVGAIEDSTDVPTSYALVNGRRAVYMIVTKRADASTLSVVNAVRAALPGIQDVLPPDIRVSFEFDQTPFVTRAIAGLVTEGLAGALLTGLMVLLFLRDFRGALVVVLNIPLALMGSVVALWLTDQTINLMTLGGLALSVGILVDEATVELENIHARMTEGCSVARAIRLGNSQTALPRLLAMLCILAVFIPALFMEGAARGLFMPLSLAVGFSMVTSYVLSNTFVPVMAAWLLRPIGHAPKARRGALERARVWVEMVARRLVAWRRLAVAGYLLGCVALIGGLAPGLGLEIFPRVDTGQFRLRLRAPTGTHIAKTEQLALDVLRAIEQKVGPDNLELTLGYVGTIPSTYPVQVIYQWTRGPEEAILRVGLAPGSGLRVDDLIEELRGELAARFPEIQFSFEPSDIVNEVMSFGSPTPIEVAVNGPDTEGNKKFLAAVRDELAKIDSVRDLQMAQTQDYPTVEVKVDREKAGMSGVTASDVSRAMVAATSSSRFVVPIYWPDPKTGIGYQVQVEIPQAALHSVAQLEETPVKRQAGHSLLLRDVAQVTTGNMPGEYDRMNMRRELSLTANFAGADLGRVAGLVTQAIAAAGPPPRGSRVEARGLFPPLRQLMGGLATGLAMAIVVIFLLLAANFQSPGLAIVTVAGVPAVLAGVVSLLWLTGTTINLQSFIGAIMAVGVAMANAILLVSFANGRWREGVAAPDAAVDAAGARLRAILMTSCAMIAGMIPMALGIGEGGEQTAPLGRAVIGGLAAATVATLLFVPACFALVRARATAQSASLDPDDPESPNFDKIQPAGTDAAIVNRDLWLDKQLSHS